MEESFTPIEFQFVVKNSDSKIVMAGRCDFSNFPGVSKATHTIIKGDHHYQAVISNGGLKGQNKIWDGNSVQISNA